MNFKNIVFLTLLGTFMVAALNGCVINVPTPGMEEDDHSHKERSIKFDRHED